MHPFHLFTAFISFTLCLILFFRLNTDTETSVFENHTGYWILVFSFCTGQVSEFKHVLFKSACWLFQIAYEGDFWCLCTVTFWQKNISELVMRISTRDSTVPKAFDYVMLLPNNLFWDIIKIVSWSNSSSTKSNLLICN